MNKPGPQGHGLQRQGRNLVFQSPNNFKHDTQHNRCLYGTDRWQKHYL